MPHFTEVPVDRRNTYGALMKALEIRYDDQYLRTTLSWKIHDRSLWKVFKCLKPVLRWRLPKTVYCGCQRCCEPCFASWAPVATQTNQTRDDRNITDVGSSQLIEWEHAYISSVRAGLTGELHVHAQATNNFTTQYQVSSKKRFLYKHMHSLRLCVWLNVISGNDLWVGFC